MKWTNILVKPPSDKNLRFIATLSCLSHLQCVLLRGWLFFQHNYRKLTRGLLLR